jgi:hypothetical protein
MSGPLTPLTRFLLWDYDRTSLPYLVLCIAILVFILLVPPAWLADPIASLR